MSTRDLLGKRLLELMKKNNISASQLSRDLKISRSVIERLKKGMSDPRLSTLESLAGFFQTTLDGLFYDLKINNYMFINVSKLKLNQDLTIDITPTEKKIYVPDELLGSDIIATTLQTSAMTPTFQEDHIIFVERNAPIKNNNYALVAIENEFQILFRKIQIEGKNSILVPENSNFGPIKMQEKDIFIGLVRYYYGILL